MLIAAAAFVACALLAAALAPYPLSLGAVVAFAGPHNWMEARYLLTRMPARWGPQRGWFRLALGGTLLLGGASIAIATLHSTAGAVQLWTVALAAWVSALVYLRRPHPLVPCAGAAAVVLAWTVPAPWAVLLVFAHPLAALWLLDHELRTRPALRRRYRALLASLPLALAALLLAAPPGGLDDAALSARITAQVGGTPRLVALYVFLQLLHYGAWIVALPGLRLREAPWRVDRIPFCKRARPLVIAALVLGAVGVIALWLGFAAATALTWDVYFQVAILHVLAETPFLVRALA